MATPPPFTREQLAWLLPRLPRDTLVAPGTVAPPLTDASRSPGPSAVMGSGPAAGSAVFLIPTSGPATANLLLPPGSSSGTASPWTGSTPTAAGSGKSLGGVSHFLYPTRGILEGDTVYYISSARPVWYSQGLKPPLSLSIAPIQSPFSHTRLHPECPWYHQDLPSHPVLRLPERQ